MLTRGAKFANSSGHNDPFDTSIVTRIMSALSDFDIRSSRHSVTSLLIYVTPECLTPFLIVLTKTPNALQGVAMVVTDITVQVFDSCRV